MGLKVPSYGVGGTTKSPSGPRLGAPVSNEAQSDVRLATQVVNDKGRCHSQRTFVCMVGNSGSDRLSRTVWQSTFGKSPKNSDSSARASRCPHQIATLARGNS